MRQRDRETKKSGMKISQKRFLPNSSSPRRGSRFVQNRKIFITCPFFVLKKPELH
jgi:hypothetical protein